MAICTIGKLCKVGRMTWGYFIQPSGDKVWIEVENLYHTPPVADPAIFERGTTLEIETHRMSSRK